MPHETSEKFNCGSHCHVLHRASLIIIHFIRCCCNSPQSLQFKCTWHEMIHKSCESYSVNESYLSHELNNSSSLNVPKVDIHWQWEKSLFMVDKFCGVYSGINVCLLSLNFKWNKIDKELNQNNTFAFYILRMWWESKN